jgi:ABC-type transport system involved in multi-copper enzyme maturation permease subunit
MFYDAFTAERMKIFKRALVWVCIACLLAFLVFDLVLTFNFAQSPIDKGEDELIIPLEIQEQARLDARMQSTWPWSIVDLFGFLYQIGWLLVFVIVASAVAQEYTWRSLHLWVSHGISRSLLILAKFAILIVVILMLVIFPAIVNGTLSAFFTMQLDGSIDLGSIHYGFFLLGIGATVLSLLPYAALGYMLAVLSKSTFVPIGAGVGFFILENVLASKQLPLTQFLPCNLVNGLSSIYASIPKVSLEPIHNPNAFLMNVPADLIPPEWAAIGLLLWTLALLGLALVIFRQQDLTE